MKEHAQEYGVRRWAGDDLIELQSEPLEAIQKLVEPYAPCIIQGCEVNAAEKRIAPGMVALWELDENNRKKGVKIARFAGCVTQSFPVYLTLKRTPEERVYVDGKNKPIAYDYTAQNTTVENEVKDKFSLEITADGGPRLVDTLGITQKLDREGGDASNVKVAYFVSDTVAELANIEVGSTLKELFGKIRRWFAALGKLAFKSTVGTSDFDDALTTAFNNKVDKVNGKGLSTEDFTTEFKTKLDKIADKANYYTHPNTAGNKHIPIGGSSGQYLKYSASGTAQWEKPTASECGALPTTGGTINGSLNVTGDIQKNGQQVYSPSNKPTPGDIGAPFLIAAGTYSVSSGMTWEVGSGSVNHLAGSNNYAITQYGIIAGCVIVNPTTVCYFARVSKVSGSVYIKIFDSNGNPAESGFYYMFISWGKIAV